MAKPRVFGADYSVYVRIVRLALAEKGVDYDLLPVDVFAEDGLPPDYLDHHPFGRIPAFEHGGFALYETGAITRYIDEAFDGPGLQPTAIRERARCNQLISIADSYAYPNLVWGIFVECVEKPAQGTVADEAAISDLLPKGRNMPESHVGTDGRQPMAGRAGTVAGRSLCRADDGLFPQSAGGAGHDRAVRQPCGMVVTYRQPSIDDG